MYDCMYVCMHACMCVCKYVCMHACMLYACVQNNQQRTAFWAQHIPGVGWLKAMSYAMTWYDYIKAHHVIWLHQGTPCHMITSRHRFIWDYIKAMSSRLCTSCHQGYVHHVIWDYNKATSYGITCKCVYRYTDAAKISVCIDIQMAHSWLLFLQVGEHECIFRYVWYTPGFCLFKVGEGLITLLLVHLLALQRVFRLHVRIVTWMYRCIDRCIDIDV